MEGQLGCSNSGLTADQRSHDCAADQQRACPPAAGDEVLGILHLLAGEQAHTDNQP